MSKLEVDNSSLTHRAVSGNTQRAKLSFSDGAFTFAGANSSVKAELKNLASPTLDSSAATRAYVDERVQSSSFGLQWKSPCRFKADSDLASSYTSNTLTGSTPGAFPETDGVTPAQDDRVLVAGQTAPEQNGIYDLTSMGSESEAWVLVRSSDATTAADLRSATVMVSEGATYANTMYTQSRVVDSVGTDDVEWVQVSTGIDSSDAGDGLVKHGKYYKVSTDGTTIGISSDALQVIDGGIDSNQLANDCVKPTHMDANCVLSEAVADAQIKERHVQDGAITTNKVADDALDSQHYAPQSVDSAAIKNANVLNQHLAADAVTFDKIAAGACDADAIDAKCITASHIADASLTEPLYATNSVSARAIEGSTITKAELANNAVEANKIKDGNVTTAKIDQTTGQEAITEACLRDNAVTTSKVANNAIDGTKIAASAVGNTQLAAGSITTDKLGTLTSLNVAGGISATDIVLSGSGATGASGYSLAKAVYFNVDFDVDYALTTDFAPIAGAYVQFDYSDQIMFTTNVFRLVYQGDGTSGNEVEFVIAHRFYDENGVPEAQITPSGYDSHSLVPGDSDPMETALFSLSGDGDDKILHSVSIWSRKTGSGTVVLPAQSDWFGLCTVVQTNSSRQQHSWTAEGLVSS